MDDTTAKAIAIAICGTVAYSTYVICTHANGLVFGTFMAFLGSIGGYIFAKR